LDVAEEVLRVRARLALCEPAITLSPFCNC
jgi:hypothetical protein